jgi:arabinose-5-phosphate isomerase
VGPTDVAILISKSGESRELLGCSSTSSGSALRSIALTGETGSTLGGNADVAARRLGARGGVPARPRADDEHHRALALGDALAVACWRRTAFRREDFARLHPGGALGAAAHDRARP